MDVIYDLTIRRATPRTELEALQGRIDRLQADLAHARKTLRDYEDMLATCRDAHRWNSRSDTAGDSRNPCADEAATWAEIGRIKRAEDQ